MFISAAGGQSGAQTSTSNNAAVPGPSATRERNLAIDLSSPRMKRLNDFWKLELRRPQPIEVIRKAKFHIRRQQFREMCEEIEPVLALQFLQNEVSSVVDHDNHEESEAFRSLLQYLLAPSTKPMLPPSAPMKQPPSPSQDPSQLAEGSGGKSRRSSNSDTSGEWTNRLPGEGGPEEEEQGQGEEQGDSEDETVEARGDGEDGRASFDFEKKGVAVMLRGIIDPLEFRANAGPEGNAKALTLTSERYRQRTEVFSSILEFISKEHKEPDGDLLHMVIGQDALYDGPGLDS